MKVKINQNELFWVQMLIDKFGLTKEEALKKLRTNKTKQK